MSLPAGGKVSFFRGKAASMQGTSLAPTAFFRTAALPIFPAPSMMAKMRHLVVSSRFVGLLLIVLAPLLAGSRPALAYNPFGVMLGTAGDRDLSLSVARAAALGVAWYRPPTIL